MNVKLTLTVEQYNTIKTALLLEKVNRAENNQNSPAIKLIEDALQAVNAAEFKG